MQAVTGRKEVRIEAEDNHQEHNYKQHILVSKRWVSTDLEFWLLGLTPHFGVS